MKKIMCIVVMLMMAPLSALAFNGEENARLLREYVHVAIKINDELAALAQLLKGDPERRLLLMPASRAAFCVQVKQLMENLTRKMRLLEPGVIVASDAFHAKGDEATRDQMVRFEGLYEQYPDHFRSCETTRKK